MTLGLSGGPSEEVEKKEEGSLGEIQEEIAEKILQDEGKIKLTDVVSHDKVGFSDKFQIDSKHLPLMNFLKAEGLVLNYKTMTKKEEKKDPVNYMRFFLTYEDEGQAKSVDIYEDTSFSEAKFINGIQKFLAENKGGVMLNSYLKDSSFEEPIFLENEKNFKTALDSIQRINSLLPGEKLNLQVNKDLQNKMMLNIRIGDKNLHSLDINSETFEAELWDKLRASLQEAGKKTLPENEHTRMFVYLNDNFDGSPVIKMIAFALLRSGAFSGAFGGNGNKSFMEKVKDGNLGKETFTDKEREQMADSKMLNEQERQELKKDVIEGNNTMSSIWYLAHSLWHNKNGDEFIDKAAPDDVLSVGSLAAKLEFSREKQGEEEVPLYNETTLEEIKKQPEAGTVVFFTVGEMFLNHFGLTALFQPDSRASEYLTGFINENGELEFYANGNINTIELKDFGKMKVNFQLAYKPSAAFAQMKEKKKDELEMESYPDELKNADTEVNESMKDIKSMMDELEKAWSELVDSEEKLSKLKELEGKISELKKSLGTANDSDKLVIQSQIDSLGKEFQTLADGKLLNQWEDQVKDLRLRFETNVNSTMAIENLRQKYGEYRRLVENDEKLKTLKTVQEKLIEIDELASKIEKKYIEWGRKSLF